MNEEKPRILVTGGAGMIGSLIIAKLREKYGSESVLGIDIRQPPDDPFFSICDVTNFEQLQKLVADNRITWIIHLSALLSVTCEQQHLQALNVNVLGFQYVIEVARLHKCRVFSASTMATFGSTTPRQAPDVTIQRPPSLYGCTKVYNELLGEWYHRRFGVDFRCLRYPCVIAPDGEARGRVVDFAVEMFTEAVRTGRYHCDVSPHTSIPFMLIDDTIDGTIAFLETPNEKLSQRVYNVTGFSCSVDDLAKQISVEVPGYQVVYEPDMTVKQPILDAMPQTMIDDQARIDWGWRPKFDLVETTKEVIRRIKNRQKAENDQ